MTIEVAPRCTEPYLPDHISDWKVIETLMTSENGVEIGHILRAPFSTIATFYAAEEPSPLTPTEIRQIHRLLEVYTQ